MPRHQSAVTISLRLPETTILRPTGSHSPSKARRSRRSGHTVRPVAYAGPPPVGLVFGEPVQPAQPIVVHHTGAYASPAGDAYADTDKTPVPDGGGKEES